MTYVASFLQESKQILDRLDQSSIENVAHRVKTTKARGGRLFFAGSGGGAGHASHAACDFRKLGGIESYSVSENVSELTARINDESFETSYASFLRGSNLTSRDCLFVFSVGGGDVERKISLNLVEAIKFAKAVGAGIVGIVGRDGGFLAKEADACVVVPTENPANVTTQVEGFQALLWHLIVQHPELGSDTPLWESRS